MRILRPAPGECVDRQTILELKMKHGGTEEPVTISDEVQYVGADVGTKNDTVASTVSRRKFVSGKVNIQPFIDEHQLIQEYLEKNWFPELVTQSGADIEFDRLLDQLREVNAEVWKVTDQAHVLMSTHAKAQAADRQAAEILYATIEQNDKRAEIVRRINELFGLKIVEKMFP